MGGGVQGRVGWDPEYFSMCVIFPKAKSGRTRKGGAGPGYFSMCIIKAKSPLFQGAN